MSELNLSLYVASYQDDASAEADYQTMKDALGSDFAVIGAVVLSCGADGKVTVKAHTIGQTAAGAVTGGGIGLVVGLFAPPLLGAMAIGAGIGALLGHLTKKHEEKQLGVALSDYLPANSSAVVAVVDNMYLDQVAAALGKAGKKISKAIDSGDYEKLEKAIVAAGEGVGKAIDS